MSFSSGTYSLPGPALNTGDTLSATENNQFRNDVATAFNLTMLRNGTSTATANLPMGGFKLTGLGNGTASGDSLAYGQTADANIYGLTVGRGAGSVSTNTAVGASALAATTSGSAGSCVGVGSNALWRHTIGNNNTGIGDYANATTTGVKNTAVGASSMYVSTGSENVAIGVSTLGAYAAGSSTGSYNVAIGNGALGNNGAGSYSTCIGYQAGFSLNGTGNTLNTFIGQSAGFNVTTGTKNTIIGTFNGNQGGLNITTSSNYIVLSDGDGNPRAIWDNNGKYLLGATSIPSAFAAALQYMEGSSATYNFLTIKDTGTSYSTSNYYVLFGNSTNGTAGSIAHNAAGTVAFQTSSDQRLKENIIDAPAALDKVNAIKVRSYDWKEDKLHVDYGFIAQELHEIAPDVVGKGDDAEELSNPRGTWQVEYGRLTPMLVKAIQELKAEFDAYKVTHP